MYRAKYDEQERCWKLRGAASGRAVLTFEQALVRCWSHPASHPIEILAIHGLEVPPEAHDLIPPREWRDIGVSATVNVGKYPGTNLWRLMPDGTAERVSEPPPRKETR